MNKSIVYFPVLRFAVLCLLALLTTAVPVRSAEEIKHLSAGVDVSDRQPHPEYPLKLVFALKSGEYLADVTVKFFQDGKLVGTIDDVGPWLFVDLKPGSYALEASRKGDNKKETSVTLEGKGQKTMTLSWEHE